MCVRKCLLVLVGDDGGDCKVVEEVIMKFLAPNR